MPFAPCVRVEDLADAGCASIGGDGALDYMTIAVPVAAAFRRVCAGVVHADGTARIQSVSRTAAPAMWEILRHYRELTGLSALLNTSLNRHGDPICRTLSDALTCATTSGIDFVLTSDSHLLCRRNCASTSKVKTGRAL